MNPITDKPEVAGSLGQMRVGVGKDGHITFETAGYVALIEAAQTVVHPGPVVITILPPPGPPQPAPPGQEYVDPYLFETGYFENRAEYEELTRKAKIKPRTLS